ncbi:MAG: CarD family transcriptional regulator [bacterium]|nr:CarD family transcriptional regulator [bacterium]
MFEVGDKVVYPLQGVGEILAIEAKIILGVEQRYYILRILSNGTTIMVPIDNADDVGLRELISPDEVDKVVDVLRGKGEPMSPKWSKRYKDNMDRLKTGSIFQLASVLRNLMLMNRKKELSFGEKRMLDSVKSLIVDEISYVKKVPNYRVEADLDKIFNEGK